MPYLDSELIQATKQLAYCNPFLAQRVELERRALGSEFTSQGAYWHPQHPETPNANVLRIQERLEQIVPRWRADLLRRDESSVEELETYRDVVYYTLYNRWRGRLLELVLQPSAAERVACWPDFLEDWEVLLPPSLRRPDEASASRVFALFFQLRRAFRFVFRSLHGSSAAVAGLRARVWQSIFTHDMRRFRRGLFARLGDFTTLITGPSGTGKELVARAIGLSRFIPFDPKTARFVEDYRSSFFALHLAALSPTLIESELFGHRKGSFSGAIRDRRGWLELCPPLGAVFLDEIGEISEELQVKLLRVLQTRTFQRIGESEDRRFEGKLIVATHRDPSTEIGAGRLRPDFYYRICSDLIQTPALRQQLSEAPGDLESLVGLVLAEMVGPSDQEAATGEVVDWIQRHLGGDYSWPGNFRELEQCVRNLLVQGVYHPVLSSSPGQSPERELASDLERLSLDDETLLRRYTTLVYHRVGSYLGAARRLGSDRRTVKARIDIDYLRQLEQARISDGGELPPSRH